MNLCPPCPVILNIVAPLSSFLTPLCLPLFTTPLSPLWYSAFFPCLPRFSLTSYPSPAAWLRRVLRCSSRMFKKREEGRNRFRRAPVISNKFFIPDRHKMDHTRAVAMIDHSIRIYPFDRSFHHRFPSIRSWSSIPPILCSIMIVPITTHNLAFKLTPGGRVPNGPTGQVLKRRPTGQSKREEGTRLD